MVKYFHHLLTADHLLNITVQVSQRKLLTGKISGTSPAAELNIEKHDNIADQHQKRKLPVKDKKHGQGACNLDKTLNHHCKTVIQGI